MKFLNFYRTLAPQKVFSTGDIAKEWGDFNYANLVNWQEKGYIVKLRNTWYAFPESIRTDADVFVLANRLYRPSYVSLESALRYYNWIPDMVFSTTSITTLKSASWKTAAGHFAYRSIRPGCFFGYQEVNIQGTRFTIAEPEKTLLDLLYFNPHLKDEPDFEGLRLNREEIAAQIRVDRAQQYLAIMQVGALEARWNHLRQYLEL